jgi:hypothetical protein
LGYFGGSCLGGLHETYAYFASAGIGNGGCIAATRCGAGGGDPGDIAKAQGNVADAATNIANGDFAKAVLDYKKAWQNAIKAQ